MGEVGAPSWRNEFMHVLLSRHRRTQATYAREAQGAIEVKMKFDLWKQGLGGHVLEFTSPGPDDAWKILLDWPRATAAGIRTASCPKTL